MPKFMFIYHGGKAPESPEAVEKVMAAWQSWLGGIGEGLVDGGNPAGMSSTVFADRVEENGGSNPVSGYTLVDAADKSAAVKIAQGCPILEDGGSVEVAEAMEM
ncbi:YciI family protein [Aliiroseovarius sp.]|uniref:YciI family protein n=1 Tax=Aliiroseovarius sp. TaxID=1872442 RepID=UPI003BAC824D